jgi:DNA-binding NtrC family response regulator
MRQAARSKVLLINSDARMRSVLGHLLREQNHASDSVADSTAAIRMLARDVYDVVLVDADALGMSELKSLARAADTCGRLIVMSERPVDGYTCLLKPFGSEALLNALSGAGEADVSIPRQRLVGRSAVMEELFTLIERVAPSRATVLIHGETGTGKELVARSIHDLSPRAHQPFVPVNCSALPETLLESELFGHTRGSFTGAIAHRRGLFEEAHGGTLFLDEVSTVSPAVQVKLLRVLQERAIQRVGSSQRTAVDFRLIAATNTDLASEVAAGRMREDFYYRLNVFPIIVPPLRKRAGDIPLLVSHFRLKFSAENGLPTPMIAPEMLGRLSAHDWPGNVRELENFVERVVIMQAASPTRLTDPPVMPAGLPQRAVLETARAEHWDIEHVEHEYILSVLNDCGGNRAHAARILGIDPRTLYRKLRAWGGQE